MHPRASIELRFHGQDRGEIAPASFNDWLAEVREMRARVLYDQGRRPFFRAADGGFDDPDPVDLDAYHIVARSQARAVGYARVVPLAAESGFISFTIGEQRFERILRDIGTTRERACEAARWAVVPEWRGELGPHLVAASWAVARWLAVDTAFVLACTSGKQDLALIRLGAHAIRGLSLFTSRISDEELRLLYFDVSHPSAWMRRQTIEAETVLSLPYRDGPRQHNSAMVSC
jgi:hypothetical protein